MYRFLYTRVHAYQHNELWPSIRGMERLLYSNKLELTYLACLGGCLRRVLGWMVMYLCLADCFQEILVEQLGTSHSNKLGFLQHIK